MKPTTYTDREVLMFSIAIAAIMLIVSTAGAERVTTTWGGNAGEIYDTGFMHMLRKTDEGVSLFNIELIQNDAYGAGKSDKGVSSDVIWGENRGRKHLVLADPRAHNAYLVLF
ncbi:hypothetical protein ACFL47_09495 [Candidatus Latescibacterota bacterium]